MDQAEGTAGPPARLRALTSWQVSKINTLSARLFAREMPLGARSDFAVLAALEEYGALSQAELGRRLGLDRNDVNGILGRLEGALLVRRTSDPTDRRRNVVTLPEAGRHRLQELQDYTDAVQGELLRGLDADGRHRLSTLLDQVLNSFPVQQA